MFNFIEQHPQHLHAIGADFGDGEIHPGRAISDSLPFDGAAKYSYLFRFLDYRTGEIVRVESITIESFRYC